MNHPHLPEPAVVPPSESSRFAHTEWSPHAAWQAPDLGRLPPPAPMAQLLRGVHSVALHVIDAVKRLEGLALPDFSRREVPTAVGPVSVLEWGMPSPGHASWLFIHGYAAQAIDWRPVLQRLRGHCQHLIAVDMPGHGRSPIPAGGVTESALLVALRDTLEACVGDAPCVLVGNSTGGLAAIRLAQENRGRRRVRGVVLISPLGGPMTSQEIDAVLGSFDIRGVRKGLAFVDRLYNNGTRMRLAQALGAWVHLSRPHLRAMIAQLRSVSFLSKEELADLPPTLVIWGDGDRILPMSGRAFFREALPNAEHAHPADFGHAPYLDRANDVRRIITGWAAKHPTLLVG